MFLMVLSVSVKAPFHAKNTQKPPNRHDFSCPFHARFITILNTKVPNLMQVESVALLLLFMLYFI